MSLAETTAAPATRNMAKFAYAVPVIGFALIAVFPYIAKPITGTA